MPDQDKSVGDFFLRCDICTVSCLIEFVVKAVPSAGAAAPPPRPLRRRRPANSAEARNDKAGRPR
jgi:hypothetical protein